jgi:hypothetical protein
VLRIFADLISYRLCERLSVRNPDQSMSKSAMARAMRTSRAGRARFLDPKNESVTLRTMTRCRPRPHSSISI